MNPTSATLEQLQRHELWRPLFFPFFSALLRTSFEFILVLVLTASRRIVTSNGQQVGTTSGMDARLYWVFAKVTKRFWDANGRVSL